MNRPCRTRTRTLPAFRGRPRSAESKLLTRYAAGYAGRRGRLGVVGVALLWLAVALVACARTVPVRPVCRGVVCGNGHCAVALDGQPRCICDPGYRNIGPLGCALPVDGALGDAGALVDGALGADGVVTDGKCSDTRPRDVVQNRNPLPVDDTLTIAKDTPSAIDVRQNDVDPDGDTLVLVNVSVTEQSASVSVDPPGSASMPTRAIRSSAMAVALLP